jgi:hypothetical protein
MKMTQRITGASMPETAFRLYETNQDVDIAAVFALLQGDLAAYRIRGFVPDDVCGRIVENFWASTERVARLGDGEDGVEAYLIGASHYGKPTLKYLEEVRACEKAIKNLYAGTVNPVARFRGLLASESGKAMRVRAAELNGQPAGDTKAIYWNNTTTYLLEPHDDLAQVKDPIQKDFEIQQATRVMAVNVYAKVQVNSGQLQIWNVEPDDQTRIDLKVANVGFPYPAELLAEYANIIIPVETGDLCLINGNLIHAVRRGDAASPKNRLLLTCFMALNLSNELIWWT